VLLLASCLANSDGSMAPCGAGNDATGQRLAGAVPAPPPPLPRAHMPVAVGRAAPTAPAHALLVLPLTAGTRPSSAVRRVRRATCAHTQSNPIR
jgi:hypothetical protein